MVKKQALNTWQRNCYLEARMISCPTCERLLFIDRIPFVDMENTKTQSFALKKATKSGYASECKSCKKIRNKKAYAKRVAAAKEASDVGMG